MIVNEKPKEVLKIGWNFDNSYAKLPGIFYTEQNPTPVRSPKLIILNKGLAESLKLNIQDLQSKDGVAELSGNKIPEGAFPLAQAYAGHQFGYFTMLGDGRAILLGEHISPKGERFDIQLKGSGRTPYSRGGDGRAALGPMLREYIISEAMYSLGIATTRSLAVVTTGENVIRETMLPGAILTRVAASHIRVGTFQYVSKWGSLTELRNLADYTIMRHYPEISEDTKPYLSFLKEVIKRQAALIAKWQLVGFIHGVMNTDNIAISGETIDYGPCAFMDNYDLATVFSSIDSRGRYAYGNQPDIAAWDLSRFAETLLPLLSENQNDAITIAEEAISDFGKLYYDNYISGMRAKLGLYNQESEDETIIHGLLSLMNKYKVDYTNTFRDLTLNKLENSVLSSKTEFEKWNELWQARLGRQEESKDKIHQLMKNSNPAIIPRNHRVEEALEAAYKDDFSVMEQLLDALASPYSYTTNQDKYAKLPEKTDQCYRTFCGT